MNKTALPFPSPSDTGQMAEDIVAALGAPLTKANVDVVSAWGQGESSTFPGYNLLGTTLPLPGSVAVAGNSAGVQLYPSLDEGLAATVDMMLGEGPQTTPLAPAFVSDLRSGKATKEQLTTDVLNSGWWHGPGTQDTYDANMIASKLNEPQFSAQGATLASAPGGNFDPLNWPGTIAGKGVSALAGSVGVFILKGVLTLGGSALFLYGASLTTKRPGISPAALLSSLGKVAPEAAAVAA